MSTRGRACIIPALRETRRTVTSRRWALHLTESVLVVLKNHPGLAVIIGGPGARAPDARLRNYWMTGAGLVYCTSRVIDCVPACSINAIAYYKGEMEARMAERVFNASTVKFRKLRVAGRVMQRPGLKVRLEKAPLYTRSLEWLANVKEEVWMVRLIIPYKVDHCLAIDGDGRRILDSEEVYPVSLNKMALEMCAGGLKGRIILAEVFQLVSASHVVL